MVMKNEAEEEKTTAGNPAMFPAIGIHDSGKNTKKKKTEKIIPPAIGITKKFARGAIRENSRKLSFSTGRMKSKHEKLTAKAAEIILGKNLPKPFINKGER